MPAISRANSITMHCKPRHIPNVGILFFLVWVSAPNFPSIPLTPKPPGIKTASTPLNALAAPSGVSQSSEATHLIFTLALFANPPDLKASDTERYASGKSIYFPTSPTVTS